MSRILSYLVVVPWFARAVNLAAMISWSRSSSWKPFENLPAAGRWLDCSCLLVSLIPALIPSPFSKETSVRSFLIRLPSNALSSALSSILAGGLLTQGFVWSWLSVLIVLRQRRRFDYVCKNWSPPVGRREYPTILSESAGLLVSIALPVIIHERHSRLSTRADPTSRRSAYNMRITTNPSYRSHAQHFTHASRHSSFWRNALMRDPWPTSIPGLVDGLPSTEIWALCAFLNRHRSCALFYEYVASCRFLLYVRSRSHRTFAFPLKGHWSLVNSFPRSWTELTSFSRVFAYRYCK